MFLKTLTIKGFKSFADPASLELEPGVSVIVGPNGSGKSNVVDAIGWVLGAQAPSAVRSQKMDDVIFAGTQSRAALGRAEVSLTIDNSARFLPVEFTEISISRTLFRTGESEYAINGVPCRLLDIQELLSDAGVGRQQHVIVSQGQIDAVLNARPEDRRTIIEEAAGVLKYRRRKEKAERRLTATETNLTRLQDLLREVRRQLRPLERQADAARRHGALVAELGALRVHLAGREIDSLRTRLEASRGARVEHQETQRQLQGRLRELDEAVRVAENELTAVGGDDLGDTLATFESLREKALGQSALIVERSRSVEREREAFMDREVIATYEADGARLRSELAEVDVHRSILAPDVAALEADEQTFARDRRTFDRELLDESGQQRLPIGGGAASGAGVATTPEQRTRLLDRLAVVRNQRVMADEALAMSTHVRRKADAQEQTWTARAEALALALDEAHQRAGADRLASVEGVLGTLLDLVVIDPGWDMAVGAALGDALTAVVVESGDAARRALAALRADEVAGGVLALGVERPAVPRAPVGAPLRARVRSDRYEVSRLLDQLLGGVVAVDDWAQAVDVAMAHPGCQIVTPDGDHCGPRGWRLRSASGQVTAAALDEARSRAAESVRAARAAAAEQAGAATHVEVARRREDELSRQLGRAFDDARADLESRGRELVARRHDVGVRQAGLDERRGLLAARLVEVEGKLERHSTEREAADRRLKSIDLRAEALTHLGAFVEARSTEIQAVLADLREQRRRQSEATREVASRLDTSRRARSGAERELTEAREHHQRAEIEEAELRMREEAAVEALRRDHDLEPAAAITTPCPPLDEGVKPAARVRDLERELRIMGPINPLALQEFEALQERHEFLQEQLDDVKATRRDLNKVVREIDREIVAVFAAAFADVATNFTELFDTLFPGGKGQLRLTDPDNLLETGIEVEARPSGKNVKKLSLLSGGERSLTALAFLFAVFRSRPSPFYVMDEVEAALDDINLHRFLDLVHEFRADAQLIIVSHQKRTMEAADCLYGVSMKPGGSSKVVSERVGADQPV